MPQSRKSSIAADTKQVLSHYVDEEHSVTVIENGKTDQNGEIPIENEDPYTKSMGAIGIWQIWICAIIFMVKFPVAWHQMSIIFLAPPAQFECADNRNGSILQFNSTCVEHCQEYAYDRSIFTETIITEWNLICDRKWLKDLTQTIFMFGILVGNMAFGHLSDRFGRRRPFIGAVVLQLVSGVATAYSSDWYTFTTMRFLLAVATGGTMITSFVLVMELVGARYRELLGILYQIPFNLGHLSLAGIGYYLRKWEWFQLAISLPSIFYLSYYFLLPESPRWLVTVGRTEEAVNIMENAAKRNKLPTEAISGTMHKAAESAAAAAGAGVTSQSRPTVLDLFRTPRMRSKTLCICFNWFVCGLCFFGVSHYIGHAGGDIFTNVAFSAAIQVPGTLLSIYSNKVFGRKKTLICSNCIAGVSCLLISVVPALPWLRVTLGCAGLWGMSISFATVYLYAGELFPTVVRNTGVGLASTVARIGSMAAPFVAGLAPVQAWLPPVVFGLVPLLGAALCLRLPETKGRKLPDTLGDGEDVHADNATDPRVLN